MEDVNKALDELLNEEDSKKKSKSDQVILESCLVGESPLMEQVLKSRLVHLRVIRGLWERGDINGAIRYCVMCDQEVGWNRLLITCIFTLLKTYEYIFFP
jgi:hypothetical protein